MSEKRRPFFWVGGSKGPESSKRPVSAKKVAREKVEPPARAKSPAPSASRSDEDTRPIRTSSPPPVVTPAPPSEPPASSAPGSSPPASYGSSPPAPEPRPRPGATIFVACLSCAAKNRVPIARLGDKGRCARCQSPITPVGKLIPLESEAQLRALWQNRGVVLVALGATWSGPWTLLARELEKLAAECVATVVVATVDVDHRPTLARLIGGDAVPSVVLYHDGRELAREPGVLPAHVLKKRFGLGT